MIVKCFSGFPKLTIFKNHDKTIACMRTVIQATHNALFYTSVVPIRGQIQDFTKGGQLHEGKVPIYESQKYEASMGGGLKVRPLNGTVFLASDNQK